MFFLGIIIIAAAYLIGSLSAALIVSKKLNMPDPRDYGSGNPGATNMLRSGRKDAAALTLAGDALKGLLAVLLARCLMSWWDMGPGVVAWAAIAVVVGHMWPLFHGFRGGKGVATALGVLLGMSFSVTLLVVAVWALIACKFKKSSLAALVSAVLAPWAMFVIDRANHRPSWGWALVVIAALVIYRHRDNIKRLCSGSESEIGQSAQPAHTGSSYMDAYAAQAAAMARAAADAVKTQQPVQTQVAAPQQQPENVGVKAAQTVETIDAAQADLSDGDALEQAVIAEAAQTIGAETEMVQVETDSEGQPSDSDDEAEAEDSKPKRGRKPRKNKNGSDE